MNLSLNTRFQADYNRYKESIDQIEDVALQKELIELLSSLSTRVRNIEKMHIDLNSGNSVLSTVSNERKQIEAIRKKLDAKLKHIK